MKRHSALVYFLLALTLCCTQSLHAASAKKNKEKSSPAAAITQQSISSKAFSYQVGPRPAFVEEVAALPAQKGQGNLVGDQFYILIDRQMALLNKQKQDYFHYKSKILSRQALQDASQVYINFNPEYEKLTLHKLRLWRDGKPVELTGKVKLDLMQREKNLEKNIYEGDVTALGVLPGVELGDEIEVEYTLTGSNPILGDIYSGIFSITRHLYTQQYSLRIYTDEQRSLNVVAPAGINAVNEVAGGVRRYIVNVDRVMPVLSEDNVPKWFNPIKVVQVSEYASWAQVGSWARGLFAVKDPLSAEMQQKINEWKVSGLSKEALVTEVLRWVQGEVRYFGIELGENSHLPSKPADTMSRRYGDCKDKTLLLHTLLKALDIPSVPVLASLNHQRNTLKMIPSAAIFDHVILQVSMNNQHYWLDATSPVQSGSLDKLSFYEYGGVLPLAEQVTALESVAYTSSVEDRYSANYHFKIRDYKQPVEFTTRLVISGNYAEHFKSLYQQQSKDEFEKLLQQDLLKVYPKLHIAKESEFKEDQANNEVAITSHYSIEQFFSYEPGKFEAPIVAVDLLQFVRVPESPKREYPFALFHHNRLSQTITLDYPFETGMKPDKRNNTENGNFWNLNTSTQLQNQSYSMTWVLKANKDAVLPQEMDKYLNEAKKTREAMGLSFRLPVGNLSERDRTELMRQLRPYNRYGDSDSSRLKAEMKEMVNLQMVSRDIESGRLVGDNLAKAYKLRASANEAAGDIPAALSDIHQAQALVSDKTDYLTFEAEILLGDGQFDAAKLIYEQLLQHAVAGKDMISVHRGLAQTLYYLNMNAQSFAESEKAKISADPAQLPYILLWQYLAEARLDKGKAQEHLKRDLATSVDRDWPLPVLEMLAGTLTPQQLIASVDGKDAGIREDHLSEAYFYIGKQYQLMQEMDKAKEAFRKCLNQNVTLFAEHNYALYELGQRKKSRK